MNFKQSQYAYVETIIREKKEIFNGDSGNGVFRNSRYPFILQDAKNNLFAGILDDCLTYFDENDISWWGGRLPNHTLSSQIACLNHLFMIRNDQKAVLKIIQKIDPEIVEILPIVSDAKPAYIQFEAVSDSDHLNENCVTRGSNCTSVDALVYGVRHDEKKILFPIEWKYTEAYGNDDKSKGTKGQERKRRYNGLIHESGQLCSNDLSIYYYEPFYQLMRQTLWAEKLIQNKETERIQADDFIHVHVIPHNNINLLNKKYPCSLMNMEETWRSCIKKQEKYLIISPDNLLSPLSDLHEYNELLSYLRVRYWQ